MTPNETDVAKLPNELLPHVSSLHLSLRGALVPHGEYESADVQSVLRVVISLNATSLLYILKPTIPSI